MTESRERGGFTQSEMQFVEAGKAISTTATPVNSQAMVNITADAADATALTLMPADK